MTDPLISMAFLTALLGSGHCIGMCGGLVAALSLSPVGRSAGPLFHLLYNLGRCLIYVLIGAGVGWMGSLLAWKQGLGSVPFALLIAGDLLVVVLGIGTAWPGRHLDLTRLEFPGPAKFLARHLLRLGSLPAGLSALVVGMAMGFLPCGFLYAMAINAASSASPVTGGAIMGAFALGTVPALLLFGEATQWLSARARGRMLRGAGLIVALMGCYNLVRHFGMIG